MKSPQFIVKAVVLSGLLFIESLLMSFKLVSYVQSQRFFNPPLETLIILGALMVAMLYTYSLTVGGWNKWEQYVTVPLPLALGVFFAILTVNPAYAAIFFILGYILLCYEVYLSTKFRKLFIKFQPTLILKLSSKGILFTFALVGSALVVISSGKAELKLDFGDRLNDTVNEYFQGVIEPQIATQTGLDAKEVNQIYSEELLNLGIDPADYQSAGIGTDVSAGGLGSSLSLQSMVTSKVNELLEPYKQFMKPLMALLVFGVVQAVGIIAYWIFSVTVGGVFWLAKKMGFLKSQYVAAQQEILTF
jgi:ABC-type multidrug transport system fused ATPase/permease subunit